MKGDDQKRSKGLAQMIVIFLCAFLLLIYGFTTKGTVLSFSIKSGQLSGLFFLLNLVLFIIPCVVVIQFIDIRRSPVLFQVQESSIFSANAVILYGLLGFICSFSFFYKSIVKKYEYSRAALSANLTSNHHTLHFIYFFCIASLTICVVVATLGLGAQHAFLASLLGGNSAGIVRHQNAAIINLSYFKHFIALYCALLSVIVATDVFEGRRVKRLFGIMVIFICGSFYGSKSPLVIYCIIFTLSYIESHGDINSSSFLGRLLLLAVISLTILYAAIYFTYILSDENFNFGEYLFNRVLIAQMAGMYEQWNLNLQSSAYALHSVPFASLFLDYPVFHKDLMMVSEGRVDANSIGIKNTFYLAEAYAAFGWLGLVLAPVLIGLSMVLNYLLVRKIFHLIFSDKRLGVFFGSYIFVFFFGLTDGVSQSLLLKGGIVVGILYSPLLAASYFYKNRPRKNAMSHRLRRAK